VSAALRRCHVLLLSCLLVLLSGGGVAMAAGGWSDSEPQVNLRHIFHGEINRQGKATGFHSRPGGRDPEGARLLEDISLPNRAGVYTARVAIRVGDSGPWREKFSTFFPDRLGRDQVLAAILHAWTHRRPGQDQPWQGPSGHGFDIQGYRSSRGGIQTAYPVYRKEQ